MKNGLFPSLTNKKEDKHETDITTTLRNNTCSTLVCSQRLVEEERDIAVLRSNDGLSE